MRCLSALLLSVCLASPALAQSKRDLAQTDAELAARIGTLESRMLTGDPAAVRLMQRMDALETTMRTLRGEMETLRYERDTLSAEVDALAGDLRAMQDLSNRMKIHLDAVDLVAAETVGRVPQGFQPRPEAESVAGLPPAGMPPFGNPVAAPSPTSPTRVPGPDASANLSDLPDEGRTKLAEGDFLGAQSAFKLYLDVNPTAPDAGEIQYWLGETYYVRGGYADAADSYIASMRIAPQGAKAPDAMVRLAAALRELGNVEEACAALDSFPVQYPNASPATRDKAQLERSRTGCA